MTNRVIGPGIGLPPPQAPYPSPLFGISSDPATNEVALAAGQSIQIPSGDWVIDLGKYSVLEFQDPVQGPATTQLSGVWRIVRTQRGTFTLRSDGVNYRISNLLGCAVSAVLGDGGSNYTSAPAIAASAGSSTWEAIVGGALGAFSVVAFGSGYTLPPVVVIQAPPAPGVPATAYAALSGSTLGSITLTNIGAGYTSIPAVSIIPSPYDPNLTSITNATAVASLSQSGKVTAVLCINNGAPVTALAATLTFTGGGGTSASANVNFLQTLSSISVTAAGSSLNTNAVLTTIGGVPTVGVNTQPIAEYTDFLPRQAWVNLSLNATGGVAGLKGPIVDGGMFLAAPASIVIGNGGAPFTALANVSLNMGSTQDIVLIQPM